MIFAVSLEDALFASKNSTASSTLISRSWEIFTPQYSASKSSLRKRKPRQASQGKVMSAINCISIVMTPAPWHVSHRPPSLLKEK